MKICTKCDYKFDKPGWKCPDCGFEPKYASDYYIFNSTHKDPGFKQEIFEKYYEFEASNFWFRARNVLINWAIEKYFPKANNFLEIGCGTGFVLSGINIKFPGIKVTGSDISGKGLSFAARRVSENVDLMQFDAQSIPFENEFDLIGAFDILEHVENDLEVLKQMHRATVKGGGVIITVPQHQFLWSQVDIQACHKRRYSAGKLKEIITLAGFNTIRLTSFIAILFPAMFLSRLIKKAQIHEYGVLAELNLPHYLNYPFEKICDFERIIIKLGADFPFGGSLLLIAKKV